MGGVLLLALEPGTYYNEYFKENVHIFDACDFLAELTTGRMGEQETALFRLRIFITNNLPDYRNRGARNQEHLPCIPAGVVFYPAKAGLRFPAAR